MPLLVACKQFVFWGDGSILKDLQSTSPFFFIFYADLQLSIHYESRQFANALFMLIPLNLDKCNDDICTGLDKQFFQRKIVNIFLPINFNICCGCSEEPSQYPQHMFWLRNKKNKFSLRTLN